MARFLHMSARPRQHGFALAAIAVIALGVPQAAAAKEHCQAPPGQAGIEQYCESMPGAGGDRPTSHSGGGRVGQQIDNSTRQGLKSSGAAGAAVLELPTGTQRGHRDGDDGAGRGEPSASDGTSDGLPHALATSAGEAASGTPTVIWVLLAIAVAFAAAAWTRMRSSSEPSA
jgi:hypothetical protein